MRLAITAALLLVVHSAAARADCASGNFYDVTSGEPVATSVTIGIQGGTSQGDYCGGSDAIPMLRQNIDTGEVVQLAAYCNPDAAGTYVDECVPAGRYRYGLETPMACGGGCSGTAFFGVTEVTSGSAACTRSTGDAGPTPYTGAVPWTDPTGSAATDDIQYVCMGGGGCNSGGSLRVHIIDLLALCGAIVWSIRRRWRR